MCSDSEAAGRKHLGCQMVCGGSFEVKIFKHGPRAPATDQADNRVRDAGAEKGHGATSAQGTSADVRAAEAKGAADGRAARTKGIGEGTTGDITKPCEGERAIKRSGRRGRMQTQMADPPLKSPDRAKEGMAREAMGDGLIAVPIFLGGKVEKNLRG